MRPTALSDGRRLVALNDAANLITSFRNVLWHEIDFTLSRRGTPDSVPR
jgi:hypothetical protein